MSKDSPIKVNPRPPRAKKQFGQHFLCDAHVLGMILQAAKVGEGDRILEIGPGLGVLTEEILKEKALLTAMEIDQDLIQVLKVKFGLQESFSLIEGDALALDWERELKDSAPLKIVANLPYNISSPLFFKMVEHKGLFRSMTLMLQREVALRLLDRGEGKHKKDYGTLSVISALHFESRLICEVPPESFDPPPKVDSAVIHLVPKEAKIHDEEGFLRFLKLLFSNRRKQLATTLKKQVPELHARLSEAELQALGEKRPENLSPEELLALYQGEK